MKHLLTFIGFLFFAFATVAQLRQSLRYEWPIGKGENNFEVANLGDEGLALYREVNGGRNSQAWSVVRLNSSLEEIWRQEYYLDSKLIFLRSVTGNNQLYWLFINPKKGLNFEVVAVNGTDGHAAQYTIENVIPFYLTHFKVSEQGVFLGGMYNYRPLVLFYEFATQKSKILPGFYHERSDLLQMKVNDDGTTEVILSSRSYLYRNQGVLNVKTFDARGNLIRDIILDDPDGRKSLLFGRSCYTQSGKQIVAGTYATRKTEYSRGLFLAGINTNGNYAINFYNYGDLSQFFSYMKARREERIKSRIARRKVKNKKPRFSYRLNVHDIIEHNDTYILLGEAFYPKYDEPSSIETAGFFGGTSRSTQRVFDGFRYTHAVVAAFNANGDLLWDNSFEINDVKTYELEQFVHASVRDDKVVLLYVYDNQIRSKIISGDQVVEDKSYDEIALMYNDDQLKDKSMSNLNHWYDDYFYVYGTQQIKNLRDQNVKLARRVFYINKVIYE